MKIVSMVGYVCIPLAFLSHFFVLAGKGFEPMVTFALAGMGVVPLAQLMGEATEHLAEKTGPTWGGLLNATFGNAAELIIAIIALTKGLNEVVKASITGSILGNLLLVAGAAMVAGGWTRKEQVFSKMAAEAYGGLLAIATAAMLLPAIFHFTAVRMHDSDRMSHELSVSVGTSVVLLIVYGLGLLFTLRTHTYLFTAPPKERSNAEVAADVMADAGTGVRLTGDRDEAPAEHGESWPLGKSLGVLLGASVAVGVVAELLVGSAEATAEHLGWSPVFIGVILLAIIGNAAEHSTAVRLALRDDMDMALTITYQSSLQIALFVTPVLVFVSLVFSNVLGLEKAQAMDLVFTPLEVAAVVMTVGTVVILSLNGRTNWFEGMLCLALYAILALVFFNYPSTTPHAHGGDIGGGGNRGPAAHVGEQSQPG